MPDIIQLSNDGGQWDTTTIIADNPEVLIIRQDDETQAQYHDIHLSPTMVEELYGVLTMWRIQHRTPNGIPASPTNGATRHI